MKQVKRVFAFLLSLCLIFSMVPAIGASAASTEFSITGINAYNFRSSGDWYIILNTDNADFSLSAVASVAASGTTVDGAAAAGGWFQVGTGTLAFTLATDKANHKVVLPAGMVLGGFTLKEDYVFFTQADGSVKAGVSVTGINAYNYREANADWYIVLGTDPADFALSSVASLATAGVTVDGEVTSGWFQATTGTLAFSLKADKADHKVVIPEGTVLGNFVLAEDYVFCTYADGSVGPAAFEITGINAYNFRGSDWYIILQTNNDKFNLSAVASVAASGTTVDGAAAAGGWFQPATGTLEFSLATDKAEHKVVLPAGMELGNYVLATDYVFYTHDNGHVDNIAPFSITGIKGYNFRGSDWYIILETSDPDFALTSVASLATAGVTVDGTVTSGWFQTSTGTLEFTLATDKAEHKVVIPAGTTLGNYKLTSDYVFYTHADGSVNTEAPVINITGIQAYNYREANADWYIVLAVDDAAFSLSSALALNATVDGEAASGWFQPTTGTLEFSIKTDKADHEIIIPAGTQLGNYTLENDYVFYTHANGQVDTTKPIQYVNITGINAYNYREANADWYIVLAVDDAAFSLPSALALNATVDGEAASGWFQATTGTLEFSIKTDKADHEIVIPAGTVLGEYVLENDYVFYTHADGAVNTEKPIKYVNITGINAYNYREANADWYIVLAVDDAAFSLPSALALNATVDGEAASGWFQATTGTLEFTLSTDKAEHEVVIPAGTVLGDYVLENDYAFYTHSNGYADNTAPVINITGINAYNFRDANADWYIALETDNDSFSLSEVISLTTAGVTVDGAATSGWFQTTTGTLEFSLKTDKAEHKVVIPAGTQLGKYTLENEFVFYTHADGAVSTMPYVYITEVSGGYNNQYIVYLTTDKAYTLTANQKLTVNVDGSDVSVWLNVSETPFISGGSAITMDEHIVVIPAGTQLGDSVLGADFTFYTHADGTVDLEDPTVDEPTYPMVELTVKDENGETVMSRSVAWHTDSIALVEQELKTSVADGKVLLGYVLDDALYASIGNISIPEGNALELTLKTLALAVEPQAEIRHGENLEDSGLRFVATLDQETYIPKVLLISDAMETLNVANAQWKIGNPYHTEEKPFIEITAADGTTCYSIVLTNIPAADYNKTYFACAGVLVEYADIGQNYVYTDAVATTVNEAAENNWISSDIRTAYTDGVMVLDADANLIGSRSYTISVSNNDSGDYVIAYTGGNVKVSALTIEGLRFTEEDGVVFGDGAVTVPNGLFAAAKLEQELVDADAAMDIGAYYGPSAGTFRYTEKSGTVNDMSVTRTHDAVYADVEDYFNAGFNIWMAEDWVYGGTQYGENDALSALDLAAEYCINNGLTNEDIKVLVTDGFINGLLDGTDMNNGDRNTVSQYAAIAESHINALISYNPVVNGVQVGTEYNCFAGFLLRDEPYYEHMTYYAPWFSFLAADADQTVTVTAWNTSGEQISGEVSCLGLLDKGYTLYFSLLGMGASKQSVVPGSTSADPCTEAEYLAYVNQFVDNINTTVWNHENMVLAFDNYGLYTQASTSFASSTINYTEMMSANWQQNYALFADIIESKGGNATFAAALRSDGMVRKSLGGFWSSNTWKEFQAFDASWGEQAISMQAYTALAHGYSYINYYTYWEPSNQAYKGETYTDACVMWDDNMNPVKQNMYYWVQSANAEVRQLENLIANFSYVDTAAVAAGDSFYTGTANVGGTDMGGLWTASQLAENSALASICASVDTTAGYFSKADGQFNDMFILVNMSHPNEQASDTVTMTFDADYSAVIVYLDGAASICQLENGQCSVTLPSGEGAIVIPVA